MQVSPTDAAAIAAAYSRQRDYWRDRARIACPNLTPRDLVIAARALHALTFAAQVVERDPDDVEALESEWRAVRQVKDPRDVAAVASVIALGNVNGHERGWRAPGAPDPFEGVRHVVTRKRSRSGRTAIKVNRPGVAIVQGRTDVTPCRGVRAIGTFPPAPMRWRDRLPSGRGYRGTRARTPYRVTVTRYRPATFRGDSLAAAMVCHVLDHTPRRGHGRNGIAVMAATDHAYRIGQVHDVRQHAQITPELFADPTGIAVHTADMAGQSGVLHLTQRILTVSRDPIAPRLRVGRAPKLRKSERSAGIGADPRHLIAPDADRTPNGPPVPRTFYQRATLDNGRVTYTSAQRTYRRPWHGVPHRWQALDHGRTVTRDHRAPATLWHGHHLTIRGPLAETTRGNRARRTIGTIPATQCPTTERGWSIVLDDIAQGDRIAGQLPSGEHWTVTRGTKWRVTIAHDGTTTTAYRGRVKNRAAQILTHLST